MKRDPGTGWKQYFDVQTLSPSQSKDGIQSSGCPCHYVMKGVSVNEFFFSTYFLANQLTSSQLSLYETSQKHVFVHSLNNKPSILNFC